MKKNKSILLPRTVLISFNFGKTNIKRFCLVAFLLLLTSFSFSATQTSNIKLLSNKESNKNIVSSNFFINADVKNPLLLVNNVSNFNKKTYHLFTHGKPGELYINGSWLKAEEIVFFLKSTFKNQEVTPSYINIYGCEFAKGEKGKQGVTYIERSLGVKVAASTNITGSSGDWVLEIGSPEAITVVKDYPYNLQVSCNNFDDFTTTCIGNSNNITFSAGVNTVAASVTNPGNNYGCLRSSPNPEWFYFRIDTPGHLSIHQTNSNDIDVDGAVWGPFDSISDFIQQCDSYPDPGDEPNFCDYDVAPDFNFDLPNTQAGEFYVLLVANFANAPTEISLDLDIIPSGATQATTDCTLLNDPDGDGLDNGQELGNVSNNMDPCDPMQPPGYTGYDETNAVWMAADCNGDGVSNADELAKGTDPYGIDSDGDDVDDDVDIDDDNDGILDEMESVCASSEIMLNSSSNCNTNAGILEREGVAAGVKGDELPTSVGYSVYTTSNTSSGITQVGDVTTVTICGRRSFFPYNSPIVVQGLDPQTGDQLEIINITLQTDCAGGNEIPWVEFYDLNGNIIGSRLDVDPDFTTNDCGTFNAPSGTYYVKYGNRLSASRIINMTLKGNDGVTCEDLDSDGDSIPNRLDLDSDGDGCPDAVEGAGSYAFSDLETNANIAGGSTNVQQNLGASSNNDGTPNVEGTSTTDSETQDIGESQNNANKSACVVDLSLTKKVNTAIVKLGGTITYTLQVSNESMTNATGVAVNNILPTGVSFVSASSTNYNTGTNVWNVGAVQANGTAILQVTARVNSAGTIVSKSEISQVNETDQDSTFNNSN